MRQVDAHAGWCTSVGRRLSSASASWAPRSIAPTRTARSARCSTTWSTAAWASCDLKRSQRQVFRWPSRYRRPGPQPAQVAVEAAAAVTTQGAPLANPPHLYTSTACTPPPQHGGRLLPPPPSALLWACENLLHSATRRACDSFTVRTGLTDERAGGGGGGIATDARTQRVLVSVYTRTTSSRLRACVKAVSHNNNSHNSDIAESCGYNGVPPKSHALPPTTLASVERRACLGSSKRDVGVGLLM